MRANSKRMLRQLKTGRLYFWSPILARRRDMAEIDMETATTRMLAQAEQFKAQAESMKDPVKLEEHRAKMEEIRKASEELSDSEKALEKAEIFKKKEIEAAISGAQKELNADDVDLSKKEAEKQAIEIAAKGRLLGEDKEYQSIQAMKTKQEILDYILSAFGEREDGRLSFDNLKHIALKKRELRLFEV